MTRMTNALLRKICDGYAPEAAVGIIQAHLNRRGKPSVVHYLSPNAYHPRTISSACHVFMGMEPEAVDRAQFTTNRRTVTCGMCKRTHEYRYPSKAKRWHKAMVEDVKAAAKMEEYRQHIGAKTAGEAMVHFGQRLQAIGEVSRFRFLDRDGNVLPAEEK